MEDPLDLVLAGTVEKTGPSLYMRYYMPLLGDKDVKLDKTNPLDREDDGVHLGMVGKSLQGIT